MDEAVKIVARFLAQEENGCHYEGYESSHREHAERLVNSLNANGLVIVNALRRAGPLVPMCVAFLRDADVKNPTPRQIMLAHDVLDETLDRSWNDGVSVLKERLAAGLP